MSAEVKPGYNLSELGLIPKSWEIIAFEQIYAEPSRNGVYKTADFHGRGTRIVNMGEMFGFNFISDQEMSRVLLTPKEIAIAGLRNGDLLFGRRSIVPAGAGKCSIVLNPVEPLICESSIIRVRLDNSRADPLFYYYFFASPIGRSLMSAIISGTNIKGIRGSELRDLRIPIPPVAEQNAISKALFDMDSLIDGIVKLISKKRGLKKSLIQELITGKRRLSGFGEEWQVKRLGDIFYISTGKSKSTYIASSGKYWIVDMGSVSTEGKLTVSKATDFKGDFLHAGDLVMPKDDIGGGGIIGRVGCIDADETYVLSDHVYRLRVKSDNPLFLSYAINGYRINSELRKKVIGSAQLGLSRKSVEDQEILLPPIDEQAAIANLLADVDAELVKLDSRLRKANQLKQGMMNELLTGRARLL